MITTEDSKISPAEVAAYKARMRDDQALEKRIKRIKANNPKVVQLFTDEIPRTTREQLGYALSLYRDAIGNPLKPGELEGDGSVKFLSREDELAVTAQRVAPELKAHHLRELLCGLESEAKVSSGYGAAVLARHLSEKFIRPRVAELTVLAMVARNKSGPQSESRNAHSFWSQAVGEFVQRLAVVLDK